jgi:threonine/homoserine/homoserine lactone efflux protein
VAAVVAVAAGVAVYYALPHSWVKVLWGVGVAGLVYLGLRASWATREARSYRWAG